MAHVVASGWAVVLATTVVACSGNGGADLDASPADAWRDDGGPGPDGKETLGGVRVLETMLDSSGGQEGSVISAEGPYDPPWPGTLFGVLYSGYLGVDWQVAASDGPCVYITATDPLYCEPACEWDEYCAPGGSCTKYPAILDVGTMTLDGLAVPITLELGTSGTYLSSEPTPPTDLFDAGDAVTLAANGGEGPPFSVSVTGVEALAPALACDTDLNTGDDLEIHWTPAAGGATVRFEIISWFVHAYSFPKILCEVPDNGSLTVSAELIALWAPERYGLTLTRLQRGTAELSADQEIALEVASVRSCTPPPM